MRRPRGRSSGNAQNGNGSHYKRPGGGLPNPRQQTFDSNGPDVRVRGNAYQVYEKYLTLARDAAASGDRIMAESYFQHAEHYFRLISAWNEQMEGQQQRQPLRPDMMAQPTMDGLSQPALGIVAVEQDSAETEAEVVSRRESSEGMPVAGSCDD